VLGVLFALVMGCNGNIGAIPSGSAGASNTGGAAGSGLGGGQTAGSAGPGTAGQGATGLGGDPYAIPTTPPVPVLVATPRVARLSRTQWSNAVRDLLKLTDISEIDSGVTGDALHDFDNEADALFVTEQLRAQLFDASEKLADKVTGDATALGRLVPANAPTDAAGKARAFITSFGQRAFRRPLTDAEVSTHVGLFNQAPTLYPGVDAFKAGASLVIQAMLQSPFFLYRTELGTAPAARPRRRSTIGRWVPSSRSRSPTRCRTTCCSPPRRRGSSATVPPWPRKPSGCSTVRRGRWGLSNFNLQVYRLGTYDGITRDATAFPDFKLNAPAAMKQEVLQFLNWMFAQGRGIRDFYTTPVGFVNSLLAPLYEVSGSFSSDPLMLTKVDLNPDRRSGLLTQAGFCRRISPSATSRTSSTAACSSRPGSCARRCRLPTPPPPEPSSPTTRT
jgi:hypothetical protein